MSENNALKKNKTLIIVGMHRSGTSLVAQWLNKCGLAVGEELLGPGIGNIDGHYEDKDFFHLHEKILAVNNLPTDGLIGSGYIHIPTTLFEEMTQLIQKKNTLHMEWGWKDPRTCLFLNYYNELIPNAYYLFLIRDYQEVVGSLIKRGFAVKEQAWLERHTGWFKRLKWRQYKRAKAWKQHIKETASRYLNTHILYNQKILDHIKKPPKERFFIANYRSLIKNHELTLNTLVNEWGFHLEKKSFASVFKSSLLSERIDFEGYVSSEDIKKARRLEQMIRQSIH